MNQMIVASNAGEIMESVIVKGDLGKLSPEERSRYYVEVCKSVGLNPLTKPFEYITLNGKLTLYALRSATDQLRSIYKVSVVELVESERDGVAVVTAKVQNGEGRTDMAKGAVTITGLKGDALANAIMKCETKAKRRATLSICGLGFLDEMEIETIPQPARKSSAQAKRDNDWQTFQDDLLDVHSARQLETLHADYKANVYPKWKQDWINAAEEEFEKKLATFSEGDTLAETLTDSLAVETEKTRDTLIEQIQRMDDEDSLLLFREDPVYKDKLSSLPKPMQLAVRKAGATKMESLRMAAMSPMEAG